jgi:hypothetical protein
LPDDVLQSGHWMMLTPPDGFMEEQMFVYAASSGGGFQVNNFALLNTPVFVPEPVSLVLMLTGVPLLVGLARRKRLAVAAANETRETSLS